MAGSPDRRAPGRRLPVFPWDTLAVAREQAAAHPSGLVDLTVGSPVDPVAPVLRAGLGAAADRSGYPTTLGTSELRTAMVTSLARRYGVTGLDGSGVLPVLGTKELVAALPFQLGVGPGHSVVIPEVAYPTYEVGAIIAGARVVRADSLTQLDQESPSLLFLNSPSNPTGRVVGVEHLRTLVGWARERGVIVASDECYLGLVWEGEAPSILDPRVSDGDHRGLLALHSLSKTSNLAGYRAGFVAGDPSLVAELLTYRKHAGLMMPLPVQSAMTVALDDDAHERTQRETYRARRVVLRRAVESAGFRVDHSEAGLYLWATRDEDCLATVEWFARRGLLVAPGEFYGPAGARHVRIALTVTDDAAAEVARRLED